MSLSTQSNTIPMEHERRFALTSITSLPFSLNDLPYSLLWQGYLEDAVGTRIRSELRDRTITLTKTIKTGEGISRTEDEQTISHTEFEAARRSVKYYLSKERYFATWGEHEVQVNVFTGTLQGYLQIEVEFSSAEAAIAFNPPDWFGTEVTHDPRHGNYHLAKDGIPR